MFRRKGAGRQPKGGRSRRFDGLPRRLAGRGDHEIVSVRPSDRRRVSASQDMDGQALKTGGFWFLLLSWLYLLRNARIAVKLFKPSGRRILPTTDDRRWFGVLHSVKTIH